jgi:hypothetical protein
MPKLPSRPFCRLRLSSPTCIYIPTYLPALTHIPILVTKTSKLLVTEATTQLRAELTYIGTPLPLSALSAHHYTHDQTHVTFSYIAIDRMPRSEDRTMAVRGARSTAAEHTRLDATWDSRASRTEWGYYRIHRCGLARDGYVNAEPGAGF